MLESSLDLRIRLNRDAENAETHVVGGVGGVGEAALSKTHILIYICTVCTYHYDNVDRVRNGFGICIVLLNILLYQFVFLFLKKKVNPCSSYGLQ